MDFPCMCSCDNAIVFFFFDKEGRWITIPWQAGKIEVFSIRLQIELSLWKSHSTGLSVHNRRDIWPSSCTSASNFWPRRGRVMLGAYWGTAPRPPKTSALMSSSGSSNLAWKVWSLLPTCHRNLLLIQEH